MDPGREPQVAPLRGDPIEKVLYMIGGLLIVPTCMTIMVLVVYFLKGWIP